jgi:putative spermidine/putrescine transport system ATP-binding protein
MAQEVQELIEERIRDDLADDFMAKPFLPPDCVNAQIEAPNMAPVVPLFEFRDAGKTYAGRDAVSGITLSGYQGEFLSIIGPSGGGKSTLLKMLAGAVPATRGAVRYRGQPLSDLAPADWRIVMVWQSLALFPHMSVEQNVGFGLAVRRVSRPERRAKIAETLDLVGLAGYQHRRIQELSGGEQQRVALARALVLHPETVLLDEPFGALDVHLRARLLTRIREIHRQTRITFVMVTHDQGEALQVSTRIAVIQNGRLQQVGSPSEILTQPATAFVAAFVGRKNVFPGIVTAINGNIARVATVRGEFQAALPRWIATVPSLNQNVFYVVPAHSFRVGPQHRNRVEGSLEARIPDGGRELIEVAVPGLGLIKAELVTAASAPDAALRASPGTETVLSWPTEEAYILDR